MYFPLIRHCSGGLVSIQYVRKCFLQKLGHSLHRIVPFTDSSTIDNEVQRLENELKQGQFTDDLKDFDQNNKGLCAIASMRKVLKKNQEKEVKSNERLRQEQKDVEDLLVVIRTHMMKEVNMIVGEHRTIQDDVPRMPLQKALQDVTSHQKWLEEKLATRNTQYAAMERCLLEIYKFQKQGPDPDNITTEQLCEGVSERLGTLFKRKQEFDDLQKSLQHLLTTA